jgi:hypothetical protein
MEATSSMDTLLGMDALLGIVALAILLGGLWMLLSGVGDMNR